MSRCLVRKKRNEQGLVVKIEFSKCKNTGHPGLLVAEALRGSWRLQLPPFALSGEQLSRITPLLLGSGASGMVWRRIRLSGLRVTPAGVRLQHAYLFHLLESAMRERELTATVSRLASIGVQPIVFKGWTVARLYPEKGLRPYYDIDIFLSQEEKDRVMALFGAQPPSRRLDMHTAIGDLADRSFEQLYSRSRLIPLNGTLVRTLGTEDHLRLLCLHLLRHGAKRPLWLCDIALFMDSITDHFDWEYFLSGNSRHSQWSMCVLQAAHRLFEAPLTGPPDEVVNRGLPGWFIDSLLKQWGRTYEYKASMRARLRGCHRIPTAVLQRWPNAVEATSGLRVPINSMPRLPIQFIYFACKAFTRSWPGRSRRGSLDSGTARSRA